MPKRSSQIVYFKQLKSPGSGPGPFSPLLKGPTSESAPCVGPWQLPVLLTHQKLRGSNSVRFNRWKKPRSGGASGLCQGLMPMEGISLHAPGFGSGSRLTQEIPEKLKPSSVTTIPADSSSPCEYYGSRLDNMANGTKGR